MELCYLNGDALDTLKESLNRTFENYLTQRDNSWVVEVCGENSFVKFRDVPDFELAPLDEGFNAAKLLSTLAAAFDDTAETVKQIKNRFFFTAMLAKDFYTKLFSIGSRSFIGMKNFAAALKNFCGTSKTEAYRSTRISTFARRWLS